MVGAMVLEILKLGFIGLAFLFMFFSYKLLRAEQRADKPRHKIISLIRFFMIICLVLSLLFLSSEIVSHWTPPFVDKVRQENLMRSKSAENCRDAIAQLSFASRNTNDATILKSNPSGVEDRCSPILKELEK